MTFEEGLWRDAEMMKAMSDIMMRYGKMMEGQGR